MSENEKVVAENRRARFEYHIVEALEAGIVLTGAEIKSVRAGGLSITEAYVRPTDGELFLLNAYIAPYSHSGDKEYDPRHPRKLLLHKREVIKLAREVEAKGVTIVPLRAYLKNGLAKIQIATAKGKAAPDKRESVKKRESDREIARALSKR